MRIAFIGQKSIGVGERGGGIEAHVQELTNELAGRGHKITVYARKAYGTPDVKQKNITVRFIPTVYRKNFEAIIHTLLATIHALFSKYDIIHYHGVGPATLSWIPRLLKPSARTIATFHSQDRLHGKWGWFARKYLHFGEWAACWFPHATIAVSHAIQVLARNVYKRQIVYIPNGAKLHDIKSTRQIEKLGLKPGKYFVNVSRLIPLKGQHYLIEAFKRLKELRPVEMKEMKLAIVGAPSYGQTYKKRLLALADGDQDIIFTGHQTGNMLKQLYAHAFLYVQTSETEGLPVSVLESMSFGTSVLASDIPENLEAMHHAGFSFKNTDVDDLTEQMTRLLDQSELVEEKAEAVQEIIKKYFNWRIIAKRTEELYRSIRH